MKFNFKLENIEVADIKIGAMSVETEFSIEEMVAVRKETEIVLEKMPEYLELIAKGAKKFIELDDEVEPIFLESIEKGIARHNAHTKIVRAINESK